jgi:hypothetical protein
MKSSGLQLPYSRAHLAERLARVMQASRSIRSEVALTVCESRKIRIASERLRASSSLAARARAFKSEQAQQMAQAIAQVLCSRGLAAFVATQPEDTALFQ